MQLLSPAAELTANSLSWPHPSSPSPHQDLGAAQDDDALGFGSFESVFITEKDLERAKEKLPEDEHKTAEESFHDVIAKLSSFHITGPITLENRELFSNAILCCDFVELSRGRLEVGKDAMLWTGITPTFSTQSKETDEWQLYILSENITNVRTKQVAEPSEKTLECSTAVMLTINETIFVQFLFDADRASACFKAILARKGQDSNLDGTIHPDTSLASGQPLFTSTSVASPAELPFLHPIHPNSSATNNAPTPSIPSVIESDLDETFRSAKQALKDARDKALESIEEAFQKG
ncbi:hypothetical protein BC829DRAFT_494060 [Chytridium lagenaria]|nr:hypothetical protein BC829DRAFT_494060 [Chytridium lagenaria]